MVNFEKMSEIARERTILYNCWLFVGPHIAIEKHARLSSFMDVFYQSNNKRI